MFVLVLCLSFCFPSKTTCLVVIFLGAQVWIGRKPVRQQYQTIRPTGIPQTGQVVLLACHRPAPQPSVYPMTLGPGLTMDTTIPPPHKNQPPVAEVSSIYLGFLRLSHNRSQVGTINIWNWGLGFQSYRINYWCVMGFPVLTYVV